MPGSYVSKKIDIVVLSHEHSNHLGAPCRFSGWNSDARPNFKPIMQSARDLNKLDNGASRLHPQLADLILRRRVSAVSKDEATELPPK
jgi:metal-dependent hydrolase (beta-lactamase superfamily II)